MSQRNGYEIDGTVCASEVSYGEIVYFEPLNMIAKKVRGKIEIDGTPEQKEILLKTIDNCFTAKEQRALVCRGGLTVRVQDLPTNYAALYLGKDYGTTYKILIDPAEVREGNDSFLHELIHHSRMVDSDRRGILLRFRSKSPDEFDTPHDDHSLEEAATLLETFARMTPWSRPDYPSYHQAVAIMSGRDAFILIKEDRELVAGSAEPGSKGLKGEEARMAVDRNFEKSNISDLVTIRYSNKSAKDRLNEIGDEKDRHD